jgi:hypothetical protein
MPTNNIVRQGTRAVAVTPSDSTDITGADFNNPAALYVGTGGDVEVITLGGSTVTLKSVPTGTFVPMQVTRVKASATTATDIIAIF